MVAPALLITWWQMVGRVVSSTAGPAGQVATVHRVDPELRAVRVEVAVALEDQGRMHPRIKLVMAVRAFNRQYLVPLTIMAVAVAAPANNLAMEDWVAVGQADLVIRTWKMVIRVQPSQGAEEEVVVLIVMGVQAAPASSSSATRRKPPSRRRARRVST